MFGREVEAWAGYVGGLQNFSSEFRNGFCAQSFDFIVLVTFHFTLIKILSPPLGTSQNSKVSSFVCLVESCV